MFKYSDEEFLTHIKKIEDCESLNDLEIVVTSSLGLKSYLIQVVRSQRAGEHKNYVAATNDMPSVLLEYLEKRYSRELGPVGKLIIKKGKPIWFSELIHEPSFVASGYNESLEKLIKLTGDGIYVPSYYLNHWSVTLATFGKEKHECSDILMWQTKTLFHQIHIKYRFLRDQFKKQVNLTPRETEVLELLATGKTNSEIAQILDIKASTVSTYVKNIYIKLGVSNRVMASLRATHLDLRL